MSGSKITATTITTKTILYSLGKKEKSKEKIIINNTLTTNKEHASSIMIKENQFILHN